MVSRTVGTNVCSQDEEAMASDEFRRLALSYKMTKLNRKETTMAIGTSQTVSSADGTAIAFERVGDGPALILVDGALGFRKFGSSPALAKLLAPTCRVYAYDRRGRGESGDTKPSS